jgi:hypothetical protein
MMGAYVIQSLVSIDELSLRVALWVGLAGLALTSREKERPRRTPRRMWRWLKWPGYLCVLLLTVGTLLLAWRILAADHHALEMKRALSHDDLSQARTSLKAALASREEPEYGVLFGQEVTRLALEDDLSPASTIRDLTIAFASARELPGLRTLASYADGLKQLAHVDKGAARDALAVFGRVRRVDPHNPLAAVELADLHLLQGHPQAAREALQPFEPTLAPVQPEYVRPYPEFWGALSITAIDLGDERTARQALAKARSLGPFDCHVLIAERLSSGGRSRHPGPVPIEIEFACEPSTAALLETAVGEESR